MPMKRRVHKQRDGRITPSTIAAYRYALELRERERRGEVDRMEAHEAEAVVDRMLGGGVRRLWLTSVFDIHRWPLEPGDLDGQRTMAQREQLDAALAEAKAQSLGTNPIQPVDEDKTA